MPVRDWPDDQHDDADSDNIDQRMEHTDPREKMRRARLLLSDVLAASRQLGDALVHAGLSPGLWRDPDTQLTELDRQAPSITLDTLLTRLAEFGAELGPMRLSGDGTALDEFEREVRDLGDIMRPLRALAQRERLKPRGERDGSALWRAMSDVRVGIALDRLTRALRDLDALAPRLRPLTADQWQTLDTELAADAASIAPTAPPARAQPSGALSAASALLNADATVPSGYTSIADEAPADPDAPTYLSSGWLPDARPNDPTVPIGPHPRTDALPSVPIWLGQRPRKWLLVLASALFLLTGTAVLSLFTRSNLVSFTLSGPPTLTSAQSTRAAGELARMPTATVTPRPTPSPVPPTPTSSLPARLTAAPNPLTLPCFSAATLTLSNTGGHATDWTASAGTGATLSPRGGTLQPGASAELSVATQGAMRGTVTIRWTGGTIKDAFHVSCHG